MGNVKLANQDFNKQERALRQGAGHLSGKDRNAGYKPGPYVSKSISFKDNEGDVMAAMAMVG